MMSEDFPLSVAVDARGVATLTLNRPQVHNALDDRLIDALDDAADTMARDGNVRVVVLTGAGPTFCAGGDIRWFKRSSEGTRADRLRESGRLATMLRRLNDLPKPLIGRINGPAYGGGVGMVSVCDVAVSVRSARFGLTEVRLGLVPANISPYVVRRIGSANARRTMLSGALFDSGRAQRLGLVDDVVPDGSLDESVEAEVAELLQAAPGAVAATKRLIAFVDGHDLDDCMIHTADRLADAWETPEGETGVACFLAKRPPPWRGGGDAGR
jgi:methylglutaconyl-CoA hydratase